MQGIQSLGPGVADKMAAMGRFDDDQIAHVAEGEVIVPAPILKYYPEVKEQVFSAIREEGLDPEQFIVGGEMVAINPNTGVQEFSFFSKVFKKIKKFVKKAAPLLIAAALPMAAPAVFGSSAVLGGAAAKLATASALDAAFKGGNLRDVLKAGAAGGVVGGIGQFASNLATGGTGGYISGANYNPAAAGASNPTVDAINKGRQQAAASTAKGTQVADASTATGTTTDFTPPRNMTEYRRMQATGQIPAPAPADQVTQQMIDALPPQPAVPGTAPTAPTNPGFQQANLPADGLGTSTTAFPGGNYGASSAEVSSRGLGSLVDGPQGPYNIQNQLPSTTSVAESAARRAQFANPSVTQQMAEASGRLQGPPTAEFARATADASRQLASFEVPSPYSYGQGFGQPTMEAIKAEFAKNPLAATGTVLSSASLAAPLFMDEEMPEQSDMTVSREELAQILGGEEFLGYQGTSYGGLYYNPETKQYQDVPYVRSSGIMTAAHGGHVMGPGTGTSDSIPAYLSDGEFVMTADAVKGAGNGDRKKGAAKMYAMMSKFEGQA